MSTCAIARGVSGRATASCSGEADVRGNGGQRADDEGDVRVEIDAELGGAARSENLGALHGMVWGARVHLVVEVVERARRSPRVWILAVLRRVGAHRGLDGASVLAEAIALRELGEDRPGELARDHVRRRRCWLRHLSIDFFEKTQRPSSWSDGMRRSVASRTRVVSSMAR